MDYHSQNATQDDIHYACAISWDLEYANEEVELELRRRDIGLTEKREEEKLKLRKQEFEMREREHSLRERELEGKLKRAQDLIFVLRQQLQQQQVILEHVQQQNRLLLSLYQASMEKKG